MRILLAAPVDTRPRTPLISFCTVLLWTLCAAHSLATRYLSTTSSPDPGELLGCWGSMVFYHGPIPWKGSGKQQQNVSAFHGLSCLNQKITINDFMLIQPYMTTFYSDSNSFKKCSGGKILWLVKVGINFKKNCVIFSNCVDIKLSARF